MTRVQIAVPLGLGGFFLYILGVLALADHVLAWPWAAQVPFFAVAGVAWAWPVHKLMLWAAHK